MVAAGGGVYPTPCPPAVGGMTTGDIWEGGRPGGIGGGGGGGAWLYAAAAGVGARDVKTVVVALK